MLNTKDTNRFWSYVKKTDNCWEWTSVISQKGYGEFSIGKKHYYAHRISWEIHNGPIPGGLWVLHRCDNRKCVNPNHLFLGTNTDNMRDCAKKGRLSPQVHPEKYRGENNPTSKMTDEKVREIRMITDMSTLAISKRFGISWSQVKRIINRQAWSHIK